MIAFTVAHKPYECNMEPSNPSVKQISYVGGCVAQCVKQAGFNLPRRGKAGSSMALWRVIDGMQRASFLLAALVAGMKPGGSQCSSWWRMEAGAGGQAVRGAGLKGCCPFAWFNAKSCGWDFPFLYHLVIVCLKSSSPLLSVSFLHSLWFLIP